MARDVNEPKNEYMVIDLKSFFASVECVERGLDPFTTNLVVADPDREKGTLCLAITPAMKALGVKNRCRVYEIPKEIDYIMASPRMQLYIDYSAEIYGICGNIVLYDFIFKTITKLKNNDKILDSALGEGFISVL